MTIRRILVGVDCSEGSLTTLRWAIGMALQVDADLVVLHAVETTPPGLERGFHTEAQVRERWRTVVVDLVEAALAGRPLRWRVLVTSDRDPGSMLLRAAREEHGDLLVVGSRGRTGAFGILMGGVSHHVTHHADVPVAVVPEGVEAEGVGEPRLNTPQTAGSAG